VVGRRGDDDQPRRGHIGVLAALRSIVTLAPAVAMQPPAPQRFHRSLIERALTRTTLSARHMIVVHSILGRPWRTALTVLGIALAVPMVVLGLFWRDALTYMIDVQFGLIERGNAFVTFPDPRSSDVVRDLAHEPGVITVEGQRIIPVRLRAGHRSYLTSVIGLPTRSELRLPRDASLRPIEAPANGITLSRRLADRLQVNVGATVAVEVLEGRRRKRDAIVTSLVDEIVGMTAYMQIGVLDHLSGEGDAVSAAALFVEPGAVFRSGDTSSVYVVKNGRAELRHVAVLRRAERSLAVASGVVSGDVVIVYPSDKIGPGVAVQQ
jgi:putative ABC transport system permease protein